MEKRRRADRPRPELALGARRAHNEKPDTTHARSCVWFSKKNVRDCRFSIVKCRRRCAFRFGNVFEDVRVMFSVVFEWFMAGCSSVNEKF